ncbi:MAG: DUF4129 domain-containing protein [Thermodesulfobacteriota bacterium]
MRFTRLIPAVAIFLITPVMLALPSAVLAAADFQAKYELPRDPDATLKDILGRSEFRETPEIPLLARLREWLDEMIKRLLIWLLERSPKPRSIKTPSNEAIEAVKVILVALAVAAFIGLAAWLVFLLRGISIRSRREPVPEPETRDAKKDARGLWEEATRLAGKGDYALALIFLFRSVLVELDERGDLVVLPERTNREILEQVRSEGHLRRTLGDMVSAFNRVRYGSGACSRVQYKDFLSLCERATKVS